MAYEDEYHRDRDRDEEFRRGEPEWRGRGRFGAPYGRSDEESGWRSSEREYGRPESERPSGWEAGQPQRGSREPGFRYSQGAGGYGERGFGERREFGQGGYGEGRFGEGYRRYRESYGRGPEGFDRSTGSYGAYGSLGYGRPQRVGGEWQRYGGEPSYGPGRQSPGGGYGYSEPREYGETFGTPGSTRGRFSGRGPKGYTRSDDRIREDVSDRLEQHGEIDATEIEVRVENAEVTLEGTVTDRRTKRIAEDVVEDSPGVKQVHNRIRVQGETGSTTAGSTTGRGGTTGTSTAGASEGTERSKGGSTTRSSTRT